MLKVLRQQTISPNWVSVYWVKVKHPWPYFDLYIYIPLFPPTYMFYYINIIVISKVFSLMFVRFSSMFVSYLVQCL